VTRVLRAARASQAKRFALLVCIVFAAGIAYLASTQLTTVLTLAAGAACALFLYAVLRKPGIGLYALAASVPLLTISIHLGVSLYLHRIVLVMLLGIVYMRTSITGSAKLPRTTLHLCLAVLMAVITVSLLVAEDRLFGLRIAFIYLELILMFYAVALTMTRRRQVDTIIVVMIVVGTLLAAYGVLQVAGPFLGIDTSLHFLDGLPAVHWKHRLGTHWATDTGFPRAWGTLPESNLFAGYLVSLMSLTGCITFLTREKGTERVGSLFFTLALMLLSLGFVLAFSRSGLVGLIGSVFSIALVYPQSLKSKKLYAVLVVLIVFLLCANLAMSALLSRSLLDVFVDRLARILQPGDVNIAAHTMTMQIAIDAFKTRPILGFGIGNLQSFYSTTFQTAVPGAHSDFLQFLAETGIVGFIAQVSVMAAVIGYLLGTLRRLGKGTREYAITLGFLSGYIGMLFGNLFYSYYATAFVWFFTAVGVNTARIFRKDLLGAEGAR